MTKIFDQRKNFDLRRLLAGSERLIDHLLTNDSQKRACNKSKNLQQLDELKSLWKQSIQFIQTRIHFGYFYNVYTQFFVSVSNNPFIFLTHSVRILPLAAAIRESIITAIQQNCSKIKNLVFAVLIANNKLIALVRMKKYYIHPGDLR